MVAPDTMNDLGVADSEELVEVFGFSGDRVELPERGGNTIYIWPGGESVVIGSSSFSNP